MRMMFLSFWATVFARLRGRPRYAAWPFSFEVMIRFLRRGWDETASLPLPALRNEMHSRPYPVDFGKKVKLEAVTLGGVPGTRFAPPDALPGKKVLYLHGGSYVFGSTRTTHQELVARMAFESRVEHVGLDYRLAPEHPYPAQLEDAIAGFDALVAEGTPAEAIVVAGDSAGGNLAIALQLALRDRGGSQAEAAVLISPWSDLTMPGRSFTEFEPIDYGTREVLDVQARAFAGAVPLADPRVSPTYAKLEGLAPTLITAGAVEIPRDDILVLAEKLKAAGVETTLFVAKDMPHNAPAFAGYHPEATRTLDAIVAFIRSQLDPSSG